MNTFTKTSLLAAFILTTFLSFAQQEPTSTLFWNNYLHTNPAMTGAVYKHQATVMWNNYPLKNQYASPPYQQTIYANYAAKLDRIHSGIGASYRYDAHPLQAFQTGLVSYAYHIPIKSMFLSIGVSGGIKTLHSDFPNPTGLPVAKRRYNPAFSSDFGIALRHEKWNVGVSLTQWNGPILRQKDSADYNFKLGAHLWVFADYRFSLGENWSLTPRVQFVMDRIDLHTNIQVVAAWKENLWFGAGVQYRMLPSSSNIFVSPMIGYDIKGIFRLGYSAMISTRSYYQPGFYNIYNRVTHEAVLSFMLK